MAGGMSEYFRLKRAQREADGYWERHLSNPWTDAAPIVPRHDEIRVINPPPPYFWLGKEAE